MKQLMQMRLFSLLSNASERTKCTTKLKDAYGEFAQYLLEKLQSETNLLELYYSLGYARLELIGISKDLAKEGEKKYTLNNRKGYCLN